MAFISQIKAGDFNVRVKLKSLSATQDDFGGVTNAYTLEHTMWANKNVKSLRDVEEKLKVTNYNLTLGLCTRSDILRKQKT